MHTWKHQEKNLTRYGATFELPDALRCWLRGHRARVEVRVPTYSEPWVLVECRICGLRYNNPAAAALKMSEVEAKQMVRDRVLFARRAPEEMARNCSTRDGYGHRRVTMSLVIVKSANYTPGFWLKIGDKHSETPFDAVVHTRRHYACFEIEGLGNLLAQRITKGKKKRIQLGARFIETEKGSKA